MTRMKIRHAAGEYDIRFATLASELPAWLDELGHRQQLIVTDTHIADLHLPELRKILRTVSGTDVAEVALEPGDAHKNVQQLERIWNALADASIRRDGLIIAFGGGVVGDMAGFAAASWMRGLDFFQIPTTLLAQVDASVGGKTAINHAAGKNLIGAFHQPRGVLVDTRLLHTLAEREYRAGIAEIIKAALLDGPAALDALEADLDGLLQREEQSVQRQITAAIELKKRLVEQDELERGQRAWLNLGHTFAHAIEQALGYGSWLHGEAVATGLVAACRASERFAQLDPAVTERLIRLLHHCELPTRLPAEIQPHQLSRLMNLDKKANRDGTRLVLLSAPGEPLVTAAGSASELESLLASLAAQD